MTLDWPESTFRVHRAAGKCPLPRIGPDRLNSSEGARRAYPSFGPGSDGQAVCKAWPLTCPVLRKAAESRPGHSRTALERSAQ